MGVPAIEDQATNPVVVTRRVGGHHGGPLGGAKEIGLLDAERVDQVLKHGDVVVEGHHLARRVAEADPGQIEADHATFAAEALEEVAVGRIVPLKLQVGHEAGVGDQDRSLAGGGPRDRPPMAIADEADLLIHA